MNKHTKVIYSNAAGKIMFDVAGDFWVESIAGLQTDVDIKETQSVGQLGTTANSQSVKPKNLTVNGCIVRNMESQREQLLATVLPKVKSRMTFILEDGSSWFLEGFPRQTPVVDDGSGPQHFQFSFYAPYPYLRSTEVKSYQLAGLTPLWRTPFYMSGTKKISEYTTDAFKRIENAGSVPQAIEVEFVAVGEVTNPEVWNVDQNRHIGIIKVLHPGERFRISTHDRDKDAGTAVQFIGIDGTVENGFRFLAPESDLTVQVAAGGNIFMARAGQNKENLRCTLVTAGGERHSI